MTATIEIPRTHSPASHRDLLIREQIMTAFQESGYHRLCQVDCHVGDGIVKLRGRVSTFHLKQIAQVIAMRHSLVRGVRNEIHVA